MTLISIISRLFVLWSGHIQEAPAGPAVDAAAELAPIEAAPVPVVEPKPSMRVVPVPMPVVVPANDAGGAGEWSRLRGRQRLGRRLAGGGFAGLGAAYVANMVVGIGSGEFGEDPSTLAGMVPVFGPFVPGELLLALLHRGHALLQGLERGEARAQRI